MAVLKENEMLIIAENAVKYALKIGASEAEAYVYEDQAISIGINLGQISKSQKTIDRGIGIRATINKSVGFAYTNIISSQEAIQKAVSNALNAAKASPPDPNWHGLPEKKPYGTLQGIFDEKIVDLHAEDLVGLAAQMLDRAGEVDKRVLSIEGGVGSAYVENAIANSKGVLAFDKGTVVECSLETIAKDGNKVTPACFEFNISRNHTVDPYWVGKEAAKLALSALKTKPVKTKTTKLILTQFALGELLGYTLLNAVKADSVQRGQSAFKDKIGTKVASEALTIYDDGLLPGGMRSWRFDAEGTPQQKTPIIENGILQNFLYDNYSAKKEGKESTGNALRSGYLSTPNIGPTNFHIMPTNKTSEDLLAEIDDGLIAYYLQGAHSSNPMSGDFSVVATPAWQIKNGKITDASSGVMLAGNVFELLKNIRLVANNERQVGSLVAPWVMVENVRVIGQ
ncbi:MAG: TldD/PmbA family protein [Candidatus Bathyarchaeota archaeon]|nr:TldD/PmbA family protein [Candidatus Bathyarchaeota archaeon]